MPSPGFTTNSGPGACSGLGNHGQRVVITITTITTTTNLDTGRTTNITTTIEERKVISGDGTVDSGVRDKNDSATTGLDGHEPLVGEQDGGATANADDNDNGNKVEIASAKKRKRDRSRSSARKKAKTSRKEMRDLKGVWDWT